ncbi:MAG: thioredoxin domain-containing protein [Candidatus Pacebacteria bacterium]|nr:thioredoxin domain-containing protein [Candidatus Paceibacterota bacterium]
MQTETKTAETTVQPTIVTNPSTSKLAILKDFSTPLAIIIAGMFIGAGLYFGGGAAAPAAAPVVADAQPEDNTDKVDPVTAEDHVRGNRDAAIKVVEFSDYDCPFCTRFHTAMQAVVEKYDDVAWVYRQFPLEQLHPNAPLVSEASECVAEIGGNDAFWKFTDEYMTARGAGDKTEHTALINKIATKIGVNTGKLTECLASDKHVAAVQADMTDAAETGGRGTPWSIIIAPSGKTYPINGALPQQTIEQLIEVARQDK